MYDKETTSLDEGVFNRGTRCQICTGCGRCAGVSSEQLYHAGNVVRDLEERTSGRRDGLRIVAAAGTADRLLPIASRAGKRLVTADLGTTTIALLLYGRDGSVAADYACVNPQVRFGADVLSRIQAAQEQEAAETMRREAREKIEEALSRFQAHLEPGETMHLVLAGNTTMVYLLMGYDPAELGRAPFTVRHGEALETEIGGVSCTVFPPVSAFVGGDITAGMYACGMMERTDITLLIDLGTNGEMALGGRERRIACATAAGPAFEGGASRGVWGADMIRILARLKREGIVDETGLLADPYFDEGVTVGGVRVTQEAVRAIQLAKGAIGAGIRLLMREYGLPESGEGIGRVVLAGGFGYFLDPRDAAAIGLLPEGLAAKTVTGGNTALAGALRLGRELLSDACGTQRDWAAGLAGRLGVRETKVLNLAGHPDFEALYLEHMGL